MKRYILNIIFFFSIVAVVDITYGYACQYMENHSSSGVTAITKGILKENSYDVMIMGSSRCVCHYDDKMMSDSLGMKVINAGFKGNGIVLMYGRYHIIPPGKKPQVLIYDVEPSFDVYAYANDDHNRRFIADLKHFYDEDGVKDIFRRVDYRETWKMKSRMYQYNSELFSILLNFLSKSKITDFSCYLPSHKKYVNIVGQQEKHEIDSLKLHYLEQLIIDAKSNGVQIVFVASPKYHATSIQDLQPVIDICNKHNVLFWDYYLDMHDSKWFCDNMHLNFEGSQMFTSMIIQRIRNEILIKN